MNEIDFVITWVDGNDPEWLKEKKKYKKTGDDSDARYRNWDLLRYWFRGVEKNAPWVRKIHFVTWGHIPEWLNTEHPKLNIVKHTDFIPEKYLPTFNSHTIELNMHRIPDLADQFVYFNDDMFLIDKVSEDYFFKNGLPCDAFQMNPIFFGKDSIGWINGSNTAVINMHFDMRTVVKKNLGKVFNYRNGLKRNIKNALLFFLVRWFPGLDYWHITNAYIKWVFDEVWEAEPEILDETCVCRFREMTNVSPFLMKDWQLVTGRFSPMNIKTGHCFHMTDENTSMASEAIKNKQFKLICINDSERLEDWGKCKKVITESFEKLYPDRSNYEL